MVNIVSGGTELGPHLSAHSGLQKISLTGSTETGKKVMAAAERLTRITLELGGNDPAIVLPDVVVDETAEKVSQAAFGNSGQICRAIKRVYVHADIYDRFCDAMGAYAAAAVVGNGLEPGTQFGPVQNKDQFDRVKELLAEAESVGRVMPGGGVVDAPGFFVRPTVVRDIDETSRLVVEEQFGPLVPVMSFTDIDDVVDRANDSVFGLVASVWSTDIDAATAIAHRISAWNRVGEQAQRPDTGRTDRRCQAVRRRYRTWGSRAARIYPDQGDQRRAPVAIRTSARPACGTQIPQAGRTRPVAAAGRVRSRVPSEPCAVGPNLRVRRGISCPTIRTIPSPSSRSVRRLQPLTRTGPGLRGVRRRIYRFDRVSRIGATPEIPHEWSTLR
ncbi:aldehyde dehydrogenase family protein [Rhodococcus opacus]|nr:aldehyde dehydrogenase family protein [Rhodococcus opacus]